MPFKNLKVLEPLYIKMLIVSFRIPFILTVCVVERM